MTYADTNNLHRKKMPQRKSRVFKTLTILLNLFFIFLQFGILSCGSNKADTHGAAAAEMKSEPLYFFDYKKINMEKAGSIDVKIENCNLYVDMYGYLVIVGEVKNVSSVTKTNIEITFAFYDKRGKEILFSKIPAYANHLREGSRVPFFYHLDDKGKYIDIDKIKIGINYKNYYGRFKGNPIVKDEKFYYQGNIMVIEGKVVNLGKKRVENLKLLCTFYNRRDQVVFIKQCFLPKEELESLEGQNFILKVLLDEYLPPFTHYRMEIFFEDSSAVSN